MAIGRNEIIRKDVEALQGLILVAKDVLGKTETRALERTLRYFAVSLANSSVAVAMLCNDGYGADALKIARSMFETGCAEMYDLFYRHASSLLHVDPVGLTMLIDGKTLEIQPGPTPRHIGVAIRMAALVFHGTLVRYSKLIGADHSEALKRIDELIGGEIEVEGGVLGSLAEAF
jgi:hypothetical protein